MKCVVCSRFLLPEVLTPSVTHLISIQSDDWTRTDFRPQWMPESRHLLLLFEDVTDPGFPGAPARDHVIRLISWLDRQRGAERPEELVVHCSAGVSRSTATAFVALSRLSGGPLATCLATVEESALAPEIWPNDLVVQLADAELGGGGAYVRTLEDWKKEKRRRAAEE